MRAYWDCSCAAAGMRNALSSAAALNTDRSCLASKRPHLTVLFSLACRFLNSTSSYNDYGLGLLSFKRAQRETYACYYRVPGRFFALWIHQVETMYGGTASREVASAIKNCPISFH